MDVVDVVDVVGVVEVVFVQRLLLERRLLRLGRHRREVGRHLGRVLHQRRRRRRPRVGQRRFSVERLLLDRSIAKH